MAEDPKLKQHTILHLGKFYPPHEGGIETHVRDLARRQLRVGRVTVIVANSDRRDETSMMDGVRVMRVARLGSIASMPVCPGLTNAIRQCPADVVHMHMPNPGAAFSFLKSGHPGKLVLTHHADTLGRRVLRRLSDRFVLQAMERASAIVVTSARYLESSEELVPFRKKCHVIPLGIDPAEMGTKDQSPEGNPHTESAQPYILAIGRLVPYKGFDVLIRAMKHINGILLLIGSGPLSADLRSLSESEGVVRKVKMLGRVQNLHRYLRAASIFVLPSTTRAEAFGIVQLEAMAAGLPVINTNLRSGVPEVSVNGETGLTVEPGDVDGLAQAIQLLLDQPELRERLGKAARTRILEKFTADLMAERTLTLYREILKGA